jgi:desulfoferrodoxin-like iron-binding protein
MTEVGNLYLCEICGNKVKVIDWGRNDTCLRKIIMRYLKKDGEVSPIFLITYIDFS